MSIEVRADNQLDTLAAFDEISALAVAGGRWISGLRDVRNSCEALVPLLSVAGGQLDYETGRLQVDRLDDSHGLEHRWTETGETQGFFKGYEDGRSFRLSVSPGTVALSSMDYNRAEKTGERATEAHINLIRIAGGWVDPETGEVDLDAVFSAGAPRASVSAWSSRSRMRMVRAVAELDYSDWSENDGALAMVTLTLPGEWESVAPDGKTFKKHVEKLRKRWLRAVGKWRCLWKLEFQRRGAPHMHLLMRVPAMVGEKTFERWLSRSWADSVGASKVAATPDELSEYQKHLLAGTGVDFSGEKFSDPRRIALYFLGHSMKGPDGKEYQHIVPSAWQDHALPCLPGATESPCTVHGGPEAGPGRFWGFSGFVKAVVDLEITHADFAFLARQLRKLKRARDWKATLVRRRGRAKGKGGAPGVHVSAVTHRWSRYNKTTRAMGAGGSVLGGWVLLNDALPVIGAYSVLLADPVRGRAAGWVGHVQPSHVGDGHRNKLELLSAGPRSSSWSYPASFRAL